MMRWLAALLIACWASAAHAAVALDACGTSELNNNSATSTINFNNLTVHSGTNRALTAYLVFANKAVGGTVAVTWNGASLAQIGSQDTSTGSGHVELWGMVAPDSGNNTLTVTFTGTSQIIIDACAWTGVNQTGGATTFANEVSSAGSATVNQAVTVTSATGHIVTAVYTNKDNTISLVSGTPIYINNAGSTVDGAANYDNGAASVTLQDTNAAAAIGAAVGVDIVAATAVSRAKCGKMSLLGAGC